MEGFFIDDIYILWSFGFSPRPSYGLGGFSLIDSLSGFPLQFPTGLGGFSPATWPFETHQLPYGARMFSVVSRFSSPVSFIRLGGFSPGSHSSLQRLSRSAELASEEGGNCNNVTLGAGAESSRSGSHVTTIIQTSPWSAWPPPQRLTQPGSHLEPRFLLILRTQPPTRLLTVYAVGRYFRLWELSVLCPLVKEWSYHFSSVTGWHRVWAVAWTQPSSLFSCADVSLVRWRGLIFLLILVRVAG